MNRNHSLSLGNKGNILLGIYILLCLGITINMSFLITDTPLTGDAAQNFRLAYTNISMVFCLQMGRTRKQPSPIVITASRYPPMLQPSLWLFTLRSTRARVIYRLKKVEIPYM